MRKLCVGILITAILVVFTASAALAWNSVTGCVTDGSGAAWPHGGTATLTLTGPVTVGPVNLDGSGCFTLNPGGSGNQKLGGTLAIVLSSPSGSISLASRTLPAPNSGEYNTAYNFGNISSGTGPNAVTLSALSAQGSPIAFGLILPVVGLAVIGGAVLRRSRRS